MSAAKGSKRSSASWSEWRDPLRMTIAAMVAYVLSEAAHLPQGYWSVLTALIVTRPHTGATMKTGMGRLTGTLYGAGLATIVSMGRIWQVPHVVLLLATLVPLGFLIAWRYEYRTAPIAAVIVLSAGAVGQSSLAAAVLRVTEIALGACAGAGVSMLLFPTRSARKSELVTAALLARLGDLLDLCALPDSTPEHLGDALKKCRDGLRELTIVAVTSSWKKQARRSGRPHRRRAARIQRRFLYRPRHGRGSSHWKPGPERRMDSILPAAIAGKHLQPLRHPDHGDDPVHRRREQSASPVHLAWKRRPLPFLRPGRHAGNAV